MQVSEKWRVLFAKAHIDLITDLPAVSVPVMADPPHLQRLLDIVIENARKYTPAGGTARLALKIEGDLACFSVSDTGIGIPADELGRIFNRFCRGTNVQQANANGSGLGLALAAWISERHRTSIQVKSVLGAGSSFCWTLPLAPHRVADDSADIDRSIGSRGMEAEYIAGSHGLGRDSAPDANQQGHPSIC
jgi:signal transduction histidine kinase